MCATLAGGIGGARAQAQAPPGWKAVVRIHPNPIPLGRCTGIEIELQDPDGFRTGVLSNGQAVNQRKFTFTSSDNTSFSWRGDPTGGIICATAGAPPATTTIRVALPDGVIGEVQLTSVAPGTSVTPVVYSPQARLRPPGFVSRTPLAVAAATPGTNDPTVPASAVAAAPSTAVIGTMTGASNAGPGNATSALLPTAHAIAAPAKLSPASAKAFVPGTIAVTSSQIAAVGPFFVPTSPMVTAPALQGIGAIFTPSTIATTAPAIQGLGPFFTPTAIAISAPSVSAVGPYFTPSLAIITDPIRAVGPTP